MPSILRADFQKTHTRRRRRRRRCTLEDRRCRRGGEGLRLSRGEDPTGERARTPSIPDNAFTAIATSPCKCSTGTKPSVRKDTFNVRPRCRLGAHTSSKRRFGTERESLCVPRSPTPTHPRPGRQSSPNARRARDDRADAILLIELLVRARANLKEKKRKAVHCRQGKRARLP